MNIDIESLQALLNTDPVRGRVDNRSAVRKAMDDNRELFCALAGRGHPHDVVVDAFLADFPDLRSSRPDLDNDEYRKHVRDAFVSFKVANGLQRRRTGTWHKRSKVETKKVVGERMKEAVRPAPAPERAGTSETSGGGAAAAPVNAAGASNNRVGGITIPTKDDL